MQDALAMRCVLLRVVHSLITTRRPTEVLRLRLVPRACQLSTLHDQPRSISTITEPYRKHRCRQICISHMHAVWPASEEMPSEPFLLAEAPCLMRSVSYLLGPNFRSFKCSLLSTSQLLFNQTCLSATFTGFFNRSINISSFS